MTDDEGGNPAPEMVPARNRPPKNFVIAWKEEENGPTLGYLVAEFVVYFPVAVDGSRHASAGRNAADPAFRELFAPSLGRKVILEALALPKGVVADTSFQAEVASMSGDFPYRASD